MAGVFATASLKFLEVDAAPITAAPLTMACWFNATNITAGHTLMFLGNKSQVGEYFSLDASGQSGGDPLQFTSRAAGLGTAVSTTGYSANTWHHACGVEVSTSSRFVYLDGGSVGTNSDSKIPTGVDRFSIGVLGRPARVGYVDGLIAEAALWNVALTAGEVAILAAAYSPLFVRPQSLVSYRRLVRTLTNDIVGGVTMTNNNGVTVGNHPRIIYPHSKHIRRYGAAAAPPAAVLIQRTLTGVGV